MMAKKSDYERFGKLNFGDFRDLAKDDSLSKYEKIGFPDSYRKGFEENIFRDICHKLNLSEKTNEARILDIGPGCTDLPMMICDFSKQTNSELVLIDSKEMLDMLPDESFITKYEGYFPDDVKELVKISKQSFDYIIAYSVFHYVFYNTCIYRFIDSALSLLKPGGSMLIGDIPNASKRRRFFLSEAGRAFHKKFTGTDTEPDTSELSVDNAPIDDSIFQSIQQRYRNLGFNCYILPQPENLPMANRREDILIVKP